jgi:hypothetical protein
VPAAGLPPLLLDPRPRRPNRSLLRPRECSKPRRCGREKLAISGKGVGARQASALSWALLGRVVWPQARPPHL